MDPEGRYAEHKRIKAFYDAEVFYYQGTDFISGVEAALEKEICAFLGCSEAETRLVSGQMANAAVFSAVVEYLNMNDRKNEPRRIRRILNNHIIKGGHLSAQPMGALKDYIAYDSATERPAIVNFPVLYDNPYKIDVEACGNIISQLRPELIIFGKSMVLHPEPVAPIKKMTEDFCPDAVIMYDMAHVLGLAGPHFQEPFKEGADIVTGSTHKTFFGTQRGIAASRVTEKDERYKFWECVRRRTFPGSVSNHHLGTMLGLLLASYEMNHFKDDYQKKVLANAKSFALACKECGLNVAGDPSCSFTETHQVIINVGYARAPEIARQLEANNIIVNYQASPFEEGFTASGALRMGVAEMTRFGMGKDDFKETAQLIADVVIKNMPVKEKVTAFRKKFLELQFCFKEKEFAGAVEKLHKLI
jgi:aminomethyltransferase